MAFHDMQNIMHRQLAIMPCAMGKASVFRLTWICEPKVILVLKVILDGLVFSLLHEH